MNSLLAEYGEDGETHLVSVAHVHNLLIMQGLTKSKKSYVAKLHLFESEVESVEMTLEKKTTSWLYQPDSEQLFVKQSG